MMKQNLNMMFFVIYLHINYLIQNIMIFFLMKILIYLILKQILNMEINYKKHHIQILLHHIYILIKTKSYIFYDVILDLAQLNQMFDILFSKKTVYSLT